MTPPPVLALSPHITHEALACAGGGLWFEVHAENYMVDGGPRLACSRRSARDPRCRCTASACRSPADAEPDAGASRRAQAPGRAVRAGAGIRAPRLVAPGRRAASPTCCRSRAPTKRLRASPPISAACKTRSAAQILIENPSHYLASRDHELERDQLPGRARPPHRLRLADRRQQCLRRRAQPRLRRDGVARRIPAICIGEIHLAGHSLDAEGTLLIDSHDAPVSEEVWALYER